MYITHTHIYPYAIPNNHAKPTPEREDETMRPPEDLRCANYIRIYTHKSKETGKIDPHRSKRRAKSIILSFLISLFIPESIYIHIYSIYFHMQAAKEWKKITF